MQSFYSQGKLLITAEYLVLDGALALAVPTKLGQSLNVSQTVSPVINWTSIGHDDKIWYQLRIDQKVGLSGKLDFISDHTNEYSERLIQIFKGIYQLNPSHFDSKRGYDIETKLEFPLDWGLGSSSTLINNLAQWAKVNPHDLLKLTFGGSGYDIACANAKNPILYKLENGIPTVEPSLFDPNFKDYLFFVHLNKKQNSRDSIIHYRGQRIKDADIDFFSDLTYEMSDSNNLEHFMRLMDLHETRLSEILHQPKVKDLYFDDFDGSIKSLGGWGGDFILVASPEAPYEYFRDKGFNTILDFTEIVL